MKKILSIPLGLVLVFAFVTTASAATPADLAGWWKFDEGSGIDTADSSENGNDGVLINSPDWVGGILGGALDFDGSNDYVNVGDDSSLDFTDKFTVEAWVNATEFQTSYYDLIVFRGYNNWAFGIYRGDRLMFGETTWNSMWSRHIYSDSVSLVKDQWHHIAVVYDTDAKTADFYLDGNPVGAGKQSTDKYGITNLGDVTINYPHSVSLNGIIDDVRIWNKALGQDELMDEMDDIVLGDADYCPDTSYDDPDDGLGVNRWIWDGGDWVKGDIPGEKAKGPKKNFTIEQTHGCSCEQILGKLEEATGLDFEGHYKHGCSSSILEDWISGEYYLETVTVPATSRDGADSSVLESGKEYVLYASGTYRFADWGDYGIADVEWAYRNDGYKDDPPYPHGWTLGEDTYPSLLGLDLQVDSNNVFWGDFSDTHEYVTAYTGIGSPAHFHIYDSAYGDNSGELIVDIYQKLY